MPRKPNKPQPTQPPPPGALGTHPDVDLHVYRGIFTDQELAQLGSAAEGETLDGEIMLLRVLVARVAATNGTKIDTVANALKVLAQLVRTERSLSGQAAQSLEQALAKALDEVATELGLG